MANFTEAEANACTIVTCDKVFIGDTFKMRLCEVTDDNGIVYRWSDDHLPADAGNAAVKNRMRVMLMDTEKLVPTKHYIDQHQGIAGETVGGD